LTAITSAFVTVAAPILTILPVMVTSTAILSSRVVMLSPFFKAVLSTLPLATWYFRTSTSFALLSGKSKAVSFAESTALNAASVGAKTVKGPVPERVSTKPPFVKAITRVERSVSDSAIFGMFS